MRKKMGLLLVSVLLPLLAFGFPKVVQLESQSNQTWKCPKCGLGNTSHRAWGCQKCHWPYDI